MSSPYSSLVRPDRSFTLFNCDERIAFQPRAPDLGEVQVREFLLFTRFPPTEVVILHQNPEDCRSDNPSQFFAWTTMYSGPKWHVSQLPGGIQPFRQIRILEPALRIPLFSVMVNVRISMREVRGNRHHRAMGDMTNFSFGDGEVGRSTGEPQRAGSGVKATSLLLKCVKIGRASRVEGGLEISPK